MIGFLSLCSVLLHENIPSEPFRYEGKTRRESITFDPKGAPLFDRHYLALKKELKGIDQEDELLLLTLDYVQRQIFDLPHCSETNVETLIASYGQREIPLDFFLAEKKGVCRHIALCVTLLLDRLIQDQFLTGECFLIRDELPWGRHAWTLFLSKEGAWHLDGYYGVLENGKTRAGFSKLCHKYGKEVIERQKERWQ